MIRDNEIYYYCNIASPSIIDKGIIKYIDYDLDLKLLPSSQIIGLDEKEYEYHRKKYAYSENLDVICKFNYSEVHKLMEKRNFPFDDQKIFEYSKLFEIYRKNQDIHHY